MDDRNTNDMQMNDDNDDSVCTELTNHTWGTKATTRTMSSAKLREIDALFEDLLPGSVPYNDKPIEETNDDQDEISCALPYEKKSSKHRNFQTNSTNSTTTSEETAISSSSSSSRSAPNHPPKDDFSSYSDKWNQPKSNHITRRFKPNERDDEEFSTSSMVSSKCDNDRHLSSHFLSQRRNRLLPGDTPSISENTTGMSSILESMGLSDHINPNSKEQENKHFHSNRHNKPVDDNYRDEEKYWKKNSSVRSLNSVLTSLLETDPDESVTSSSYFSNTQRNGQSLKKSSSSNKILSIENIERRRRERQMNLRASVILIFFLGILLFAVQFDTAASAKKHILLRGKHRKVHEQVALRADGDKHDNQNPPKIKDNIFGGINNDAPPKAKSNQNSETNIPPPAVKKTENLSKEDSLSKNVKSNEKSITKDLPPQSLEDKKSITKDLPSQLHENNNSLEEKIHGNHEQATKNQDIQSMLPTEYKYLSENTAPDLQHKDLPLFWNIPRSGGSFIKTVLTMCKGAVLASEAGIKQGHDSDTELRVVTLFSQKYVNVDVSTSKGIDRAKALGLAQSGFADAVVTAEFQKSLSLFDENHHGRAFTIIRHPIERAASIYSMLVQSGHENVSKMNVEEYARSPFVENNWMVRFLTGNMNAEVTEDQTNIAKEVLRTKFIVGLLEHKGGSLRRFEDYFGWTYTDDPETQYQCRKASVTGNAIKNESAKEIVKEGTQAWNLLAWQNKFDLELYEYARDLYREQGNNLFQHLIAKAQKQR